MSAEESLRQEGRRALFQTPDSKMDTTVSPTCSGVQCREPGNRSGVRRAQRMQYATAAGGFAKGHHKDYEDCGCSWGNRPSRVLLSIAPQDWPCSSKRPPTIVNVRNLLDCGALVTVMDQSHFFALIAR